VASDAFTQFKHLLLPITDRKPYLSEGTKQVTFFNFLILSELIFAKLILTEIELNVK
jgi:hypothetical protein